jgi:glycosyltransferase involved in cell wall biosynthesis
MNVAETVKSDKGGYDVAKAYLSGRDILNAKPFFKDDSPKFRILYSGNLGRAHPISTIIEAAAILQTSNPEIEFVFVGDGAGFDKIAQARSRRGLDNIRLLPPQPLSRLKDLMEGGDIHLISMKHEVLGMLVPSKLYAALAAGRPCIFIGPENSETAKVIHEFGAGIVVPQGQAYHLAEAILKFRNDGDTWFAAQNGAIKASNHFVPSQSISSWIKGARETIHSRVA